jgi:hypothetical protein
MKKTLFLLFVLFTIQAFSQQDSDSYSLHQMRMKETLDANFVEGEWQSLDSAGGTIRFEYSEKRLHLVAGDTFFFHYKDSLSGFRPIATLARWPPEDCYVKPIDENTIEVTFYSCFWHQPPMRFQRIKK